MRSGDEPRGRRALPAVARAVRDAVRPGPHAAADDRAGPPRAALPVDPRGRHQRQVLDDADDRRDPLAPRPAHRRLPVAAPGLVRRADPDRRRGPRAGRVRRRDAARRARRRARRPLARRRRPGHPVRGADRGGLLGAGATRGRGRGDRGGPGRPLRRHQRDPLAGAGADQRRARAHALAGPDDRRHRRREARRRQAGRDARARARPASRRARAGPRAWPPSAAPRSSRPATTRASRSARRASFQRRNFAVALAAAQAYLGELDGDAVAAAAAQIRCPGGCRSWARTR